MRWDYVYSDIHPCTGSSFLLSALKELMNAPQTGLHGAGNCDGGETGVGSVCMSTSVHKSRHRSPWCCWRWTSSTINSMFIMFHRLIGGRVGLTHSQTDTHAAFYIRISYKLANCQMEVVELLYWLFENNKVRFIYQWLLLSEAGAVAGDHGVFRSEFSDVDWDPWWSQDPWWVNDAKLDLTCPREALQAII